MAVREGGGPDIEGNAKLRLAVDKAREANMPKENIQRAIDRGSGRGGEAQLETITYEGFGPLHTAVIVECISDNRNRSGQEVKAFFDKHGGQLAGSGAVSYLFDRKGQIEVEKKGNVDEQLLALIDCGAEDIRDEPEGNVVVVTAPDRLHQVVVAIEGKGFGVKDAELVFQAKVPKMFAEAGDKRRIEDFLNGLDELDDVQRISTDYQPTSSEGERP